MSEPEDECLSRPPHAPNPNTESDEKHPQPLPEHDSGVAQSDNVPSLRDENWALGSITGLAAVKMLIESVQALADANGHIGPTAPTLQQPSTPRPANLTVHTTPPNTIAARFAGSLPLSPISPASSVATQDTASGAPSPVVMPSPEALRDEPLPPLIETCHETPTADSLARQQAAIARRFFLKTAPPFSLSEYLLRMHTHCPHSPAVYMAAAAYIHRLSVVERLVPASAKTIHRLSLTSIRVAAKALEDNKWSQERIAKVGGVSRKELKSLEINLCYLLDFELFVREAEMRRTMFLFQQQTVSTRTRAATTSDVGVSSSAVKVKPDMSSAGITITMATRVKE